MSEIIRQVEAAIDQGAHHGEYAERVVSLQFLRRVLAALRVPTIAVTDEMVDAALTEYVGEPPFEDYFGEEGVGPHRLNMRAALEAAYRDARLKALRDFTTELERRLANVIALSENVLRGQVWPHGGNSFARAIADAARGKHEATPSSTIAAPSPSNEVTAEMVERCYDFQDRFGCGYSREHIRALLEAALKARKPSPSQADDARQVAGEIETLRAQRKAVEELAAKLRREDRFAYAADIYDALERDG